MTDVGPKLIGDVTPTKAIATFQELSETVAPAWDWQEAVKRYLVAPVRINWPKAWSSDDWDLAKNLWARRLHDHRCTEDELKRIADVLIDTNSHAPHVKNVLEALSEVRQEIRRENYDSAAPQIETDDDENKLIESLAEALYEAALDDHAVMIWGEARGRSWRSSIRICLLHACYSAATDQVTEGRATYGPYKIQSGAEWQRIDGKLTVRMGSSELARLRGLHEIVEDGSEPNDEERRPF